MSIKSMTWLTDTPRNNPTYPPISAIKDSAVIIITAGIARKPGMSRDDLIETNLMI